MMMLLLLMMMSQVAVHLTVTNMHILIVSSYKYGNHNKN